MAEACEAFGVPVVGGNVSLYNESRGRDIDPTPVVGLLGLVDDLSAVPPGLAWGEGDAVLLVGSDPAPTLAGSRWARDVVGHHGGVLPPVDLATVAAAASAVAAAVAAGEITAVHDVAEGGLGVALAEQCVVSGIGIAVGAGAGVVAHRHLFSETPGRVVASCRAGDATAVSDRFAEAGVPVEHLGVAAGDRLVMPGLLDIALADLTVAWRDRLPRALGAGTAQT